MDRRAMLSKSLPAAALATATAGAAAIGAVVTTRPVAEIPVRRREYRDTAAEWVCGVEDVVWCTPTERTAILAARPEMVAWHWLDCGDRVVGRSPYRKPERLTPDR
jgi:hypothetical protein